MPDRELRHMRRTELVEIILALKQSEDRLRAENAALSAQLQERQIHIENAGSIAQAALELNKVFEAAQAAADEYVASVLAATKTTECRCQCSARSGGSRSQQILAQAQTEAANLRPAPSSSATRKRKPLHASAPRPKRTARQCLPGRSRRSSSAGPLLTAGQRTAGRLSQHGILPEERAK